MRRLLRAASAGGPLACSHLVDHLKDAVGERGVQVRVSDLLDAEHVEHLVVGEGLQLLELVDGLVAVVDRDKVQQLLVLVDVHVELLDRRAVRIDIFLDRALRLEEALESSLTHGHLLELGLLVALPGLGLGLQRFLGLATAHCRHHRLHVQHLTAQGHIRILEGVTPLVNVLIDLGRQFLRNRVRQHAFCAIAVAERVDGHILERQQVEVNLLVVLVLGVIVGGELTELLDLFLKK